LIKNNTVFVIGAGASWHYGYPTGEGLVDAVIEKAAAFESYCQYRSAFSGSIHHAIPDYVHERTDKSRGTSGAVDAWEAAADESKLLSQRLSMVRPILIDHFLAWNETLRPIGKLLIAMVILECEARWRHTQRNQNRSKEDKAKDAWYRFIIHKLVYDCQHSADLFQNNVKFITFNYDVSLERILYQAISDMDLFDQGDVLKFLSEDRIVHVYGAIDDDVASKEPPIDLTVATTLGDANELDLRGTAGFEQRKNLIDRCFIAAQLIRTVDPHDKEEDAAALQTAKKWIEDAGVVYILGYGFDDSNNRRIGLDALHYHKHKAAVMFTNFGDLNVINKKASSLFYGMRTAFLDGAIQGNPLDGFYAEKSIRNVYDALNMDFDALENELTASTRI